LRGSHLRASGSVPGFLHSPHYTLSRNATERVTKNAGTRWSGLRDVCFLPFSRALSTGNPVWKGCPASCSICLVPFFDLDDRIRELCAKIAAAREAEVEPVLRPVFFELKFALHQHAEQLRRLAAGVLPRAMSEQPNEGRCRRSIDANGRVYWTFTWSRPAQGAISPQSQSAPCPRSLESAKATKSASLFRMAVTSEDSCKRGPMHRNRNAE
jgi:hypothetical protein